MDPREAALLMARTAEDRKASDVLILDITKITLVADYFVIASAPSMIRVRAIADAVGESAKQNGLEILHREGYDTARWVLLDYGSVVVHVFTEEERLFYSLERLWGDAPIVEVAH